MGCLRKADQLVLVIPKVEAAFANVVEFPHLRAIWKRSNHGISSQPVRVNAVIGLDPAIQRSAITVVHGRPNVRVQMTPVSLQLWLAVTIDPCESSRGLESLTRFCLQTSGGGRYFGSVSSTDNYLANAGDPNDAYAFETKLSQSDRTIATNLREKAKMGRLMLQLKSWSGVTLTN